MRIVLGLCLALVLVAATPSESSAQAVADEFTFKVTPPQMPAFLTALAEIGAAAQRLGTAPPEREFHIWQSYLGGASDELVLVIQYPSLQAWAEVEAKSLADPALQQAASSMVAAGIEVVSIKLRREFVLPL